MCKWVFVPGSVAAVMLSIVPPLCLAGDASDWKNVSQLQAGEKIRVVRENMKTVNGRFESFTEDSITVRQESATVVVPKGEVVRVSITSRSHRLRNLALGAVAGAGAGVLLGHLGTQRWNGGREGVLVASALVGLGCGTAVGATIPDYPTVYRSAGPVQTGK